MSFTGREYTVEFENVTLAAASGDIDLFSIDPATDKPVAIKSVVIKTTSELQEAQEEWLRLRIIRGHTTVGSGGAAATARPLAPGDSAFGGSCRTNDTTIASAGTAVNLWSDALQVRVGYELFRAPEDYFWTAGAEFIVVRLMAAVTDDVIANATIDIVEIP
jgi:hypothetical protein